MNRETWDLAESLETVSGELLESLDLLGVMFNETTDVNIQPEVAFDKYNKLRILISVLMDRLGRECESVSVICRKLYSKARKDI